MLSDVRTPALKTKFDERTLQSCRPCCLEQSPSLHSVCVKHQTFQETSQNLRVYIVILTLIYFVVCRNMKCPPFYFVGGQ